MLDFRRWEAFGKWVSSHVIHGAVNKLEFAVLDYPMNEVEAYIGYFLYEHDVDDPLTERSLSDR